MKKNTTRNHPAQHPTDSEAPGKKPLADTAPETLSAGLESGPAESAEATDSRMAGDVSGLSVDDTPSVASDAESDVVSDVDVKAPVPEEYTAAPETLESNEENQTEPGTPDDTDKAVSSVRRVDAPGASTGAMLFRSRITAVARSLPERFKTGIAFLFTLTTQGLDALRGFIRQIGRKGRSRNTGGGTARIRRTDRERVYKLRGYTTFEKVNAKRKAQRRFKLAQRILITVLCIGSLGYIAFSNNPFTDVDELLRIIGIRNTVSISFQQFAFPLVLTENTDTTVSEITPDQDFARLILDNGTEDDVFHYQAYRDIDALKAVLAGCRRTISDEDIAKIARDHKIGTILVLLAKEGNTSTYRFSDVRQSGVMVDVSATSIASTGGDSVVYFIGMISDKSYLGYSFDIIPVATSTMTSTK